MAWYGACCTLLGGGMLVGSSYGGEASPESALCGSSPRFEQLALKRKRIKYF